MSVVRTREQIPQIAPGRVPADRRPASFATARQSAAPGGITAADILRILRKRKRLIIGLIVLFTMMAFVVTLLWRIYKPYYTAVAYLGINPLQPGAFSTQQGQFVEVRAAGLKAAHARMLKRESIYIRTLDSPEVKKTAWYQKDREGSLERLPEILSVTPASKASLISVEITEVARYKQDQVDLAEIANALARAYEEDVREAASRARTRHIKRLRDKRADLREMSDAIQAEIKRKQLPEVQILQDRMKAQGAKLEVLAGESAQLGLIKAQVETALKELEEHGKAGTFSQMSEVTALVESDLSIRTLREEKLTLETRRASLLKRLGPKHRSVVLTSTSLAAVGERLAQATQEAVPLQAQALKELLLARLEDVTRQLLGIVGLTKDIHDTVEVDLTRNLIDMRELRGREQNISGNVEKINNTLLQLELLAEADRPVWLRAKATRPKIISIPKWTMTMPLGVLVGLALGLGLAFLLELTDTSIKGPADLANRMDLPVLGMIPHGDDLDEDFEQMPLAFMEHPNSMICEAHRHIRTCLLFSGPISEQRSLLITSPLPGDGRTTISMNLAHSIAQGGRRVLVVDANFHQPAIARLFPQCTEQGLSNVLVGQSGWREHTVEIEPNLTVLAAGLLPPNPAELLGSEKMRTTVVEMMQSYDQVLIDGPPCLVVSDPVQLSTLVDGVVLVVRAEANTFGIVRRVRDMFPGSAGKSSAWCSTACG